MTEILTQFWPVLAIGFSFLGAIIIGFNQHFQVDGRALVMGRLLGVLPLAGLAWVIFPWPNNPAFYVSAAGMGLLLAAADICLFDASRTYGGRLAALYVPLKMVLAFVVWGMLAPESVLPVLTTPWRLGAVLLAFAAGAWALANLRKCDASWPALLGVVPVAVLFALGDVVAKVVIPEAQDTSLMATIGGAAAFLFTTNLMAATVVALSCVGEGRWPVFSQRTLWVSAGFGGILYKGIGLLLVTISLAPNPGYVAAITMMSAVWLALWGRWMHGERTNWGAAFVLVLSGIAVAWVTAYR